MILIGYALWDSVFCESIRVFERVCMLQERNQKYASEISVGHVE